MPAPVFISLNKEEDSTLYELTVTNGVPRRTKLRAIALRLNPTHTCFNSLRNIEPSIGVILEERILDDDFRLPQAMGEEVKIT